MKYIITIRPSLNTIKIWSDVKEASSLYTSLIANRGIANDDLDMYSVDCSTNELVTKELFEFSDPTTLEIKKSRLSPHVSEESLSWDNIDPVKYSALYSESELADIEFNLAQPDNSTWRAIPNKDVSVTSEILEYDTVQTICVTKLNPFS